MFEPQADQLMSRIRNPAPTTSLDQKTLLIQLLIVKDAFMRLPRFNPDQSILILVFALLLIGIAVWRYLNPQ